jgi:hypothetical protein
MDGEGRHRALPHVPSRAVLVRDAGERALDRRDRSAGGGEGRQLETATDVLAPSTRA